MNKREYERLIQLAFGELPAEQAERTRQDVAADAAAAAELRAMEQLRADLKRLPVPEHQLSTERLREAILDRGLHAQPASAPWWRLAWMPAAALAITFLGTQLAMMRGTAGEPSLAMGQPDVDFAAGSSPLTQPSILAEPNPEPAPMAAGGSDSEPPARQVRPRRTPRVVLREPAASPGMTAGAAAESHATMVAASIVSNAGSQPAEPQPSDIAAIKTGAPSVPEPQPGIVLIGNERDADTGAQRAIEVTSTSNVVIGG